MAGSGAALLLLLLLCCYEAIGNHQDSSDERKLFGGYRIVPKPCRPEGASEQDELGICMFNYECAAREGEVVGACMDGFLFGACCRLPAGQTFELPDPELLMESSATFPPDNVNSIVATSKRPDNMESSSISEILNNPQHHVALHPEADTVLIDQPKPVTNRPSSNSELSTFSYVDNNNVEEQSSTPKYNPEEKSTMPVTPTYYSTGSKWTTRPWPPPTSSYMPISSANNFEEGLVLVPTITVSSNNNKRPDPSPEPGGPDPESINHIISLLNDSNTGLIDPGPEPEPEIISLDNSSPPGLSTWVSVNGRPSASASWKPDSTSYTKIPTHNKPQTHRPSFTSSHHIVGPTYDVVTQEDQGSRPVPTVIVLGPLSSEPTTKTPTTKRPNIITGTNKLPTTSVTLVTKRPSSKPPPGFFITKRPSSTVPTFTATRPRPTQQTTQYTNRPSIITHYDKPVSHYDHPSTQYERPTTQFNRPSTQYDRPTTPYDRPTTQFLYRPTTSSTIRPPSTTYYTYPPSTYITQRPSSGSGITHLTNRPPSGTIFVTNRPTSSHRPSSGTTLVSNRPWTTTPMDYPDTTIPADHLANFPPVRNPSFNTTQHERPPVVLPPNPEDLFNVDDLPTPVFQEDDKLNSKLQVFVDKLVQSLDGNFQDLEDVLIDGGNFTSSTFISTTKRPATKPTSRRPTQTTSKPTRRPTSSGSTPVRRPSTTVRPGSRPSQTPKPRPSSRPSTIRPIQTRPSQSARPTLSTRPSTRPTSRPTSRPTQTSRPSTRPTQTTKPPQKVSSVKPSQSTRPRPTRPNTTFRPSSTHKAPTTKRSTTTSSTTQLLVQQDDTVKPAKTTTTTEEPSTFQENIVTTILPEESSGSSSKPDYKHECGVRPLMQKSGRIVGGKGATFGEWPWQVLVRESTWLGLFTKNKCGGVLITSRYVITAAHCQPGFLANLVAVFGEFDISGELESRRSVTKNVRRVIVHRQYDAATFANDLALLELESPVAFDEHIVPICMPKDKEDFTGRVATVTGWGRLKYGGGVPNLLQEVQVPVIENAVCQEMFHTAGHNKVILNSFLCAGYANGQKDSCEGDSGGPLMLERDDGRWVLVGTVSHGIKCAAPYLPGVYMRTTYYKPWLQAITGVN